MKIRSGFVSNSSSSSFIVAFPKDLEISSESIQKYLLPHGESITAYDWVGTFTAQQIAEQVANDMRQQTPNVDERISEALGGYVPGAPSIDSFRDRKNNEYNWDAYSKANEEFLNQFKNKIHKEFEGMDIYTFEYSDNDGNFFCTMEHGGIFDNVPHVRVSNH